MKASSISLAFGMCLAVPGASARLGNSLDRRRLTVDEADIEFQRSGGAKEAEDRRREIINKNRWPECRNMTAVSCKELIDYEIMTLNTDVHTTIRSVIIDKRTEDAQWYNAVAIPLWSNGWVAGKDGDGLVYYDFPWVSSGVKCDQDAERDIPLIELDPDTKEPVPVTGSTLDDYLSGEDSRPICGGSVYAYDTTISSTVFGAEKLATELSTTRALAHEGQRSIGPWDCSGMSGIDCCLMIKHEVRDMDEHNHAIQCYLDYKHGTRMYYEQQYNARVRIFANHDGFVSQTPVIG